MNPLQPLPNPIVAVCAIIQAEMGLDDDQLYLYNQKFVIPPDMRMYIAVGVENIRIMSNVVKPKSGGSALDAGLSEDISANCQGVLSVNIMSRSDEALLRKEEVVLALGSQFSRQVQQAQTMLIGKLPVGGNIRNLSELEPTAIPYRFQFSLAIHYLVKKQKRIPYFSDFPNSVLTEA